jgi:hypothetical protein
MSRYIVAVRMSDGAEHKHIAGCAIVNDGVKPYVAYTRTVAAVIESIDSGTKFITRDWKGDIADVVVVTDGSIRYLRTKADGVLSDNLLRLPRYAG